MKIKMCSNVLPSGAKVIDSDRKKQKKIQIRTETWGKHLTSYRKKVRLVYLKKKKKNNSLNL